MCDSALDLLPQTASSKRQCQYSFSGDKRHKEVIIRTLTSFYRLDLGEDSHVSCYTGMGQKHKRLTNWPRRRFPERKQLKASAAKSCTYPKHRFSKLLSSLETF